MYIRRYGESLITVAISENVNEHKILKKKEIFRIRSREYLFFF